MGAAAVTAAALVVAAPVSRAAGEDTSKRVELFRFGAAGARLGVALEDVRADDVARLHLPEERGAVVKEVSKGSAAEKAGLKEGDVVLSFQGEKVWSAPQLRRLVRETPPGRHVSLEVSRAGAVQRLAATLEESKDRDLTFGDEGLEIEPPLPPMPPMPPMPPLAPLLEEGERGHRMIFRERLLGTRPGRLGLSIQEVSGQLARYFKVDDGGLLVTDVEAEGPAGKAGVRAGDVIVKVDGKAVADAEDLRRAIGEAAARSEVVLTVQREGRPLDLKVTLRGERRARQPRSTT
jgi:S1-C subfamily serine protease